MQKQNQKCFLENKFKYNVSMKKYCSFRCGGIAEIFFEPENIEEIKAVLQFAKEEKKPIFILGGGTNILVCDDGIEGIVISLKKITKILSHSEQKNNEYILIASANCATASICSYSIKNSLKGFNIMLGIPGTIGGAVAICAGTNLGNIKDILCDVKILDEDGNIKTEKKYKKGIILEASFLLRKENASKLEAKKKKIIEERKKKSARKFS